MSSVAFHPTAFTATTPPTTTSGAAGTASTSNSSADQTSISALGSTFLNLLTQELQNQDPTAPMDSTEMVGQMISLNQLDQIASINQLLTSTLGSAGASAAGNTASNQQPGSTGGQGSSQSGTNPVSTPNG